MLDPAFYEKADSIISEYRPEERFLIPIIQDIQEEYSYVPPELLDYIAKKLGISEAKAYSVASFYVNFSFEAKGKYVIRVCDGTACHVRKSAPVLEALYKELGLKDRLPGMDEEEQMALLATDGMLVKRPILVGEDFVLTGFLPKEWEGRLG